MATYIFGDIQGCFDQFMRLLEEINYDPKHDRLGFVGDLVNRGPKSLEALRFIQKQHNPIVVLGNHDLHLLAIGLGARATDSLSLDAILGAPDKFELLEWLRQQPLIFHEKTTNTFIVHAGIPPQWSTEQAMKYSVEISEQLRGNNAADFLLDMYGSEPKAWSNELQGSDRWRYIINAFTRMRFCNQTGELDIDNKTSVSKSPKLFKPWFEWRKCKSQIVFGHWASLEGKCSVENYYALDTGCIWGNQLTALRLEDKQLFSVPCTSRRNEQ